LFSGVALEGVEAEPVGDLLRFANRTIDVSTDCVTTPTGGPLSLEALPSFYNFALYSHTVGQTGSLLAIPKLRDYAFV
jgi:hypothetical protein